MNNKKKNHAFVYSSQRIGLEAKTIMVEIDISRGMHAFNIIGLGDKAVEEAKDRVSSAIKHTGYKQPKSVNRKIVASLAPGNLKKSGTLFDTPIALSYLLASEEISFPVDKKLFVGELGLDGTAQKASGLISIARQAKDDGFLEIYVPVANSKEMELIDGIKIFPYETLRELIDHLEGKVKIKEMIPSYSPKKITDVNSISLDSVKGQESVKRALVLAAAGGHNIALYGPPGTGKTLLAKALITILPELNKEECIEATSIHSISGGDVEEPIYNPPFRQPHHSSSYASVVGGGVPLRPGEISLAHRGVLFLDEFPEFDRRVIESLREPLEEKSITITRTSGVNQFPASCILCIAFNPCPCGKSGTEKICTCSEIAKAHYRRKLTGPIADRIDIWVCVEAAPLEHLKKPKNTESTLKAVSDVVTARTQQKERFSNIAISLNSEVTAETIDEFIPLKEEVREILEEAARNLSLSPRGFHKTMKCARTIADIQNKKDIEREHILEAINYRTPPDFG